MKLLYLVKKNIRSIRIVLEVLFIYITPVLLLYVGAVPYKYRFLLLLASVLTILFIIKYERIDCRQLGLYRRGFGKSVVPHLIVMVIGVQIIFMYSHIIGDEITLSWHDHKLLLLSFIPISFIQQFVYQGFLLPRLDDIIKHKAASVAIIATVFAFMHIIYGDINFILLTWVGGVIFAVLYLKYKNIFLTTMTHSAWNLMAVILFIL